VLPLVAALIAFQAGAQPDLPALLSRVAEQAELMAKHAPAAATTETLRQRFAPDGKSGRPEPSDPVTREVVSEFTVGSLPGATPPVLVEFRRVLSVDGRPVRPSERSVRPSSGAAEAQATRKRMLDDFARHGLEDIATDYSLILLAFSRGAQQDLVLAFAGEERVGAEDALVLTWSQNATAAGGLVFAGRSVERTALQGKLYLRKSDGFPLRVWAWSEHPSGGITVRDEATVDYVPSAMGFPAPASVRHQHIVGGRTRTENLYRYEAFRRAAETSPR
jgi:hypothetical protein